MFVKTIFEATSAVNTAIDTGELDLDGPTGSPVSPTKGSLPDELVIEYAPSGGAMTSASIVYRDIEFEPGASDVQAWTAPADAAMHHVFIGRGSQPGTAFSRNIGGGSPIVPRGRIIMPNGGVGITVRMVIRAYWYGEN